MTAISIEELLGAQYDVLGHGINDGFTEIRIIKTGKQIFCKGKEDFINEAQMLCGSDVYVGINSRRTESGFATDVGHLSCLVIDIDPIRPKETASTESQLEGSLALGRKIVEDFNGGYLVSSGSGCHVYLPISPIKVENWEALTASVKKWLDLVREKYAPKGKSEYKIDHIFDLPRIIRVWGSLNTRSNRVCGPTTPINEVKRLNYSFSQKAEDTPKAQPTLGDYEQRFNSVVANNKRLHGIVTGTITYPSKSESDFEFVALLAKAHFTVDEIKALYPKNPTGNKEPKKGDVERIVGKILEEEGDRAVSLVHHTKQYKTSLANRRMGFRTGLKPYDEMVSGLQPEKLYIFGARPGEGKTTLGVQIADHLASTVGPVTYHSTEVGYEPIFDKIVSRRAAIDLTKFQNGSFLEDDKTKIDKVMPEISNLPLIVLRGFGLNIDKVEEDIKKYAPAVHILDFFQTLSWTDPKDANEKYQAVKKLKKIAQDYHIPIILMSQLARGQGKLTLASLSETKALEEYGDVIAFLDTKERLSEPRKVYLDVQKSKYSATGLIRLDFHRKTCQFREGLWTD